MKGKTKILLTGLIFILNKNYAQDVVDHNALRFHNYISTLTQLNWFYDPQAERRAKEVMQDNEFEPTNSNYVANIYANPVLIDGKMLDYRHFDLTSSGILTVVKGNPEGKDAAPIPFYVNIRRNGKIVQTKKMSFLNKKLYKIDLIEIFPHCKIGDMLIIKPAQPEYWKAKRILKLLGGDGC